jgi:hypothetical protein
MNEPRRFRDADSDAPDELRELFRKAKPPSALSAATEAKLAAGVATIAATRTLPLVKVVPWLLGAAAIAGATFGLRAVSVHDQGRASRVAVPTGAVSQPAPSHAVPTPKSAVTVNTEEEAHQPPPKATVETAAPKPSTPARDPLSAEAELLNAAHRALARDPNQALAIAREHARRYPQGQLAAERELIVVQALVKLGRTREAEARGRELRKSAPKSIYDERLDKVLGDP